MIRLYNLRQKKLRKMYLVCLILEYFTPKTGTLKILPPPPPQKKQP